MVKADFSSSFLCADNCPDDTVVVIVGKPTIEEKDGTFGKYNETNIPVEFLEKAKTYSPSKTSGNKMVTAWGDEMDLWVGKKFTVKHVLTKVKGETKTVIEAYPVNAPLGN